VQPAQEKGCILHQLQRGLPHLVGLVRVQPELQRAQQHNRTVHRAIYSVPLDSPVELSRESLLF